MKPLLAVPGLIVSIGLGGCSAITTITSTPGLYEIDQSRQAVKNAKSWHMEGRVQSRDGKHWDTFIRDVMCPSNISMTDVRVDAQGAERTNRMVILDGHYYSQRPDGQWLHSHNDGPQDAVPDCSLSPLLPSKTNLFGDFNDAMRNAKVTKQELRGTGEDSCRSYEVSFSTSNGYAPSYWLCIGETDHLPRRVAYVNDSAVYEFTKWNAATVTAPGS